MLRNCRQGKNRLRQMASHLASSANYVADTLPVTVSAANRLVFLQLPSTREANSAAISHITTPPVQSAPITPTPSICHGPSMADGSLVTVSGRLPPEPLSTSAATILSRAVRGGTNRSTVTPDHCLSSSAATPAQQIVPSSPRLSLDSIQPFTRVSSCSSSVEGRFRAGLRLSLRNELESQYALAVGEQRGSLGRKMIDLEPLQRSARRVDQFVSCKKFKVFENSTMTANDGLAADRHSIFLPSSRSISLQPMGQGFGGWPDRLQVDQQLIS